MQKDKGQYLAVGQLCERYGVSRSTIYSWMEQGRLPRPINFTARCVRWRPSDLSEFEAEIEAQAKK